MILAFAARGRKIIAFIWLALLYVETVLPAHAVGKHSRPSRISYAPADSIHLERGAPGHSGNTAGSIMIRKNEPAILKQPFTAATGNEEDDIGGPGQPESGAFHSANSDNMVDLFTGDFSYTIPLLDVGGYPVTLGYNSGISMDQEASWVGLGWNINPGAITRNMRGVPDDFNGTDSITKTLSIKDSKTFGVTTGADVEVVGFPIGLGASLGIFHNTYRGWGLEYGLNASINAGVSGMGTLTGQLSATNNSQDGLTLGRSLSFNTGEKTAEEYGGFGTGITIGDAYNSRSGMKGLQLSEGFRRSVTDEKNREHKGGGGLSQTLISFANPAFTPSIGMPYTSYMYTVTLKVGAEIFMVHPSWFVSGYWSNQYIEKEDQVLSLPAYGYLNYQNSINKGEILLDYNREKEIPYREKPAVPNIAIPSYTYDVFSVSGEGTGGMFRAYRGDIGFVYDNFMKTKDRSGRISLDLGLGNVVHGGVDLNLTRSFNESGPWVRENPLGPLVAFKDPNKLFEASYFRNPGEKTVNDKSFYEATGGDDVVSVDLYQPGNSSSTITSTTYLNRYRDKKLVDKIQLTKNNVYKHSRDKRQQVISYLTAEEASVAGFTKYIENYRLNTFGMGNCSNAFPGEISPDSTGLRGEYYLGTDFNQWIFNRLDPEIDFLEGADFNEDLPSGISALNEDFSVRWTGRLKAPVTGTYTLVTAFDDGVRLFMNGESLINRWGLQPAAPPNRESVTVNLVGGELYDIRLELYQHQGLSAAALYWEYEGNPLQIIPTENLYPPPVDTFVVGIDSLISKEERVNVFRKANHISEIDVLNADGRRYIYGLPVYNLKQQEATFSVNAADGNEQEGLVKYIPGTDDSPANVKGNDHYFSGEEVPAYAHSFLLTSIVSPDYIDITGDGITDDDPGDAVKFNYTKAAGIHNPYSWRVPYTDSAGYNQGLRTDTRDDKGNYVYGEKELWYLHSIESKNMIATFKLGDRDDLPAIDKSGKKKASPAKRLEEINLYTKADFAKYNTAATPVKTVHFSYSYKLCPGINGTDSNSGKLTLDSVWFTYNGNEKGRRNPYVFHYYKNNPGYNSKSYDRWGNYKDPLQNPGSSESNLITNAEYPYALQDSVMAADNAAAWTMDSIILPSGGRMKITYESDDYAYVQHHRAAQLFKIAGFSVAPPSSLGDLSNQLYSNNLFDTQDHLYVAVNVPKPVSSNSEVYSRYLQGLETTYFKLFVQMPSDKWGHGSEYVPCYATLDPGGGYGFINGNTIWVKIKAIDNRGNLGGSYSPLAKAAIQFLRLNLPSKAYPGSDVGDNLDAGAAVKMLLSMADNIKNTVRSFDTNARIKGWARTVDTSRTFIRLNNPFFKKYGGGLRVKRIVIYDHWNAMTRQKEATYGQEYEYTDTKMINGAPEAVSTGVAAYEPVLGGEENPLRLPVQYVEQVAALAPVSLGYTEEPLGESFYPAPTVGYSKVRVRSIHTKNVRSANGYEETCFYTSYDFPTLTDRTDLANGKKRYKPALANFLRIDAKHFVTVSQGFKVELNDMHGKLRSKAVYSETGRIAYTENYYHVDDVNAISKHLNNTVKAISPQGIIDPAASIGKDVELMMDMREHRAVTNANNANINTEMFVVGIWPWLIPSLLSLAQRDENRFRSVAVTKVINRHGIIDSVLAEDKGSRVVTTNLLYDNETGAPLLTSTQNEFNDPVYQFTYPVAWAYDGMGGAYRNIGLSMDGIYIKQGKIISGLAAGTEANYFASGDELLVWSKPKTGGADCVPDIATFPAKQKIWAIDGNALSGGAVAPEIYFMNADGSPFTGNDVSLKVIRSGRRNISASMGSVTMLVNPLQKDVNGDYGLVIDGNSKIINATVTEYKQDWQVVDRKKSQILCTPSEN